MKRVLFLGRRKIVSKRPMSSGRCAQARYRDSRKGARKFVSHGPPPAPLQPNPVSDSGLRSVFQKAFWHTSVWEPARNQYSEGYIPFTLMRVLSSGAWPEWKDQVRNWGRDKIGQDTWTVPEGFWTLHLLSWVPRVFQTSSSDTLNQTDV